MQHWLAPRFVARRAVVCSTLKKSLPRIPTSSNKHSKTLPQARFVSLIDRLRDEVEVAMPGTPKQARDFMSARCFDPSFLSPML